MRFESPLVPARLARRYKRFLADVVLDSGEAVTAHCANPGAMTGLTGPGMPVWLSRSANPKRALAYSWELALADGGLVGINTAHPNRIVAEAIAARAIPELTGYAALRCEVPYGHRSRVDIVLDDPARGPCYIEIKNVHLMRTPGLAEFPDSVTERGAKHMAELAALAAAGTRAAVVFLVQRSDARAFAIAADVDPAFAAAAQAAQAAGVELLAYCCALSPAEIVLDKALPFAP